MDTERTEYASGTWLTTARYLNGGFVAGCALCSDGKVRKLARIAEYGDTFFSVRAAVKVRGKTVAGFVSIEGGLFDTGSPVTFTANKHGVNAALLPEWPA
jgi:hypothetical protein